MVQTPKFVQRMFPKRLWAFPNSKNSIYLTFDDGPIPEVTPWVLDILKTYQAKATFFCIGDNVRKYPEIFERIISEGHAIGNHTFNHLNGRKTPHKEFLENVEKAQTELSAQLSISKTAMPATVAKNAELFPNLFRPPYGQLTASQARSVQQKGYQIVMWNVLSMDYDKNVSEEKCFENVAQSIQAGSIVVFHDSLKAQQNMQYALPKVLEVIVKNGWNCEKIQEKSIAKG